MSDRGTVSEHGGLHAGCCHRSFRSPHLTATSPISHFILSHQTQGSVQNVHPDLQPAPGPKWRSCKSVMCRCNEIKCPGTGTMKQRKFLHPMHSWREAGSEELNDGNAVSSFDTILLTVTTSLSVTKAQPRSLSASSPTEHSLFPSTPRETFACH